MSLILLDVGGTTINFKLYKEDYLSSYLVCEKRKNYSSKKTLEELLLQIRDILSEYYSSDNSLIIGLPGPFLPWKSTIYCPPLGYQFNLNKLDEYKDFENIFICNDLITFLLSSYINCIEKYKSTNFQRIALSIGTSLGHGYLESYKKNLVLLNTYESAHQHISSLSLEKLDHLLLNKEIKLRRDFLCCRFLLEEVFTYKNKKPLSFFSDYKISNSLKYYQLLDIVALEIIDIVKVHGDFISIDLYGGFADFLKNHPILFNYLAKTIKSYSENKYVLENLDNDQKYFPPVQWIKDRVISTSINNII